MYIYLCRKPPGEMLVFRRNMWYAIQLPFSDPMLTEDHKRIAAAVAANGIAKGLSVEVATATAEKTMYEKIYRSKNPSGKA